jgi:putative redox protein
MALSVVATWKGGFAADVRARSHAVRVDEPETAGGTATGMMPTELFAAALASCFCLAVGFAAGKRDLDVPGLRVTVSGERVEGELRYQDLTVLTEAAVDDELLARLVERARPLCWISNSLATGVNVEYVHATTVNEDFRK